MVDKMDALSSSARQDDQRNDGMRTGSSYIDVNQPAGEAQSRAIKALDNNALIIRLQFTINHLSRWLSPIHDPNPLERSRYQGEPTVKAILLGMRDHEQFIYPRMYVTANDVNPNLDSIPAYEPSAARRMADQEHAPIVLMANFRRLRQGTCALLRSLPDNAWDRSAFTSDHDRMTIRQLAENLADHDYRYMRAMDQTLTDSGAREGLAEIQKTSLDELLTLVPEKLKV